MNDRELLYKIIVFALIDIRAAAYEEKSHKAIFLVADLIHNLPLKLASADSSNGNYSDILCELKERARIKKCDGWLDGIIKDLSEGKIKDID